MSLIYNEYTQTIINILFYLTILKLSKKADDFRKKQKNNYIGTLNYKTIAFYFKTLSLKQFYCNV